ncbi:MAG TPA: hypothetical protein VLE73_04510 [Candidatus Saccharimonadales bacterium]|nr:hypothetical protein [Candidatus Saccharimonadales bacterium]
MAATSETLWKPHIDNLTSSIERRRIAHDVAMGAATTIIKDLVRTGSLPDFAVLQQYLDEEEKIMQLTAVPFRTEQWKPPNVIECRDIVTSEPRGHWLNITIGNDTSNRGLWLAAARWERERNLDLLRTDTGYPVLPCGTGYREHDVSVSDALPIPRR